MDIVIKTEINEYSTLHYLLLACTRVLVHTATYARAHQIAAAQDGTVFRGDALPARVLSALGVAVGKSYLRYDSVFVNSRTMSG